MTDPLTFAGVLLLLFSVALLACYLPSESSTGGPVIVLRHD